MLTPSPEIIQLLEAFAPAFTKPTFQKVLALIYGTILAPGKRTVTAALRVLGLEQQNNFGKYHRVLNQAQWSPWKLSRILLGLLLASFVPSGMSIVLLVDETLERRAGKKIVYKGWFRDAVRCVGGKVATTLGIRWLCLCLLVSVPWSARPWALPFLAVPVLSEKTCAKCHKPHRSGVWWTAFLLQKIRAWYPEIDIVLVGDGGLQRSRWWPPVKNSTSTWFRVCVWMGSCMTSPGSNPQASVVPSPRRESDSPTSSVVFWTPRPPGRRRHCSGMASRPRRWST